MGERVILDEGLHEIPAAAYHADCCAEPSLSSGIAKVMVTQSPRHAWQAHPRLNPNYQRAHKTTFDRGGASHRFLLEGQTGFVIIDAPDWKTKAARAARAEAWLANKIPLLKSQWDDVMPMAESARAQLDAHEDSPIPFRLGDPERVLVWREGDVWCRSRLDWFHRDKRHVDDYKTTKRSAEPSAWIRGPLFSLGSDIQAAFYLRGIRKLFGVEARWRFVVQENFKPFALSVIGLGPDVLALAERKVERAIALWGACLRKNRWPIYSTRTCYADLPGWEEQRWMEREAMEVVE